MKNALKQLIQRTPIIPALRIIRQRRRWRRELKEWEKQGRLVPPPHLVKQRAIIEFAEKRRLRVLIERGPIDPGVKGPLNPRFLVRRLNSVRR